MVFLLQARERILQFYSKYDNFCKPALKFLLALVTLILINGSIGYSRSLTNFAVTLVLALVCSFLPVNVIVVMAAGIVLLHLYALSLESVIIIAALFLVMFLLYFRFTPKDAVLLLLTPMSFKLGIPYVVPIAAGLLGTPASVVSAGCGVVVYFMLSYISGSAAKTSGEGVDAELINKFRYLLDDMMFNKQMILYIAAFGVTILCVYFIRRLSKDHSWTIAISAGALLDILVMVVGALYFKLSVSIGGLILGSMVAVGVAFVIKFFVFNVDYSRTERVQFEDDEYYYYVKAIPKNTVKVNDRKVKKINGSADPAKKSREGRREKDRDTERRRSGRDEPVREKKDAPEYRMHRALTERDAQASSLERDTAAKARANRERRRNNQ